MASCVRCKKSPADYQESYLVVTRSTDNVTDTVRGKEKTVGESVSESLVGAVTCGICMDCHNKSAKATVRFTAFLGMAAGFIFVIAMKAGILAAIGAAAGGFLVMGGLAYLYCYKYKQEMQAQEEIREHLKAYASDMGANRVRLFIPVGENYYKSLFLFQMQNKGLSKPFSEKIYHELIESGAWKEYVEKEAIEPSEISPYL